MRTRKPVLILALCLAALAPAVTSVSPAAAHHEFDYGHWYHDRWTGHPAPPIVDRVQIWRNWPTFGWRNAADIGATKWKFGSRWVHPGYIVNPYYAGSDGRSSTDCTFVPWQVSMCLANLGSWPSEAPDGQLAPLYDGGGHIIGSVIRINSAVTFWTDARLLNVVMHEIGHGLGLGHEPMSTSIMYGGGNDAVIVKNMIEHDKVALDQMYYWHGH